MLKLNVLQMIKTTAVTMKLLLCASVALLLIGSSVMAEGEKEKKDKENMGTVIGIDLGTTYSW